MFFYLQKVVVHVENVRMLVKLLHGDDLGAVQHVVAASEELFEDLCRVQLLGSTVLAF